VIVVATRGLIRGLIKKYVAEPALKVNWKTWGDYPARVQPAMYVFEFEGEFVDTLTTKEAKVLALHEIAHFNSFFGAGGYEHGDVGQELSSYGLFNREKLSYGDVNNAVKSIHAKWRRYYG
jgi:hypothetical protein